LLCVLSALEPDPRFSPKLRCPPPLPRALLFPVKILLGDCIFFSFQSFLRPLDDLAVPSFSMPCLHAVLTSEDALVLPLRLTSEAASRLPGTLVITVHSGFLRDHSGQSDSSPCPNGGVGAPPSRLRGKASLTTSFPLLFLISPCSFIFSKCAVLLSLAYCFPVLDLRLASFTAIPSHVLVAFLLDRLSSFSVVLGVIYVAVYFIYPEPSLLNFLSFFLLAYSSGPLFDRPDVDTTLSLIERGPSAFLFAQMSYSLPSSTHRRTFASFFLLSFAFNDKGGFPSSL